MNPHQIILAVGDTHMHPNGHTVAMAMNNQLTLLCLGYNVMPLGS
jgi:hypothetical protein